MSWPSTNAEAKMSLGDVAVDLKVAVEQSSVSCTLTFRGTTMSIVFGDAGVARVLLPPGSSPEVRELAPGEVLGA